MQSQTNSLATGLGTNWVNISSSAQTNRIDHAREPVKRRCVLPLGASVVPHVRLQARGKIISIDDLTMPAFPIDSNHSATINRNQNPKLITEVFLC